MERPCLQKNKTSNSRGIRIATLTRVPVIEAEFQRRCLVTIFHCSVLTSSATQIPQIYSNVSSGTFPDALTFFVCLLSFRVWSGQNNAEQICFPIPVTAVRNVSYNLVPFVGFFQSWPRAAFIVYFSRSRLPSALGHCSLCISAFSLAFGYLGNIRISFCLLGTLINSFNLLNNSLSEVPPLLMFCFSLEEEELVQGNS